VGWQPSQFLADRAEAERAYQLAERLGSVNAAAAELGTTAHALNPVVVTSTQPLWRRHHGRVSYLPGS
jgi:hypothetical protein